MFCRTYGCTECGPRRSAYVAGVAALRAADALAAGQRVWFLSLSGHSRGLHVGDVGPAWSAVADLLDRRLGRTGFVKVIHLDPGRPGSAHVHALWAMPGPLRRADQTALVNVAQRGGFGFERCRGVRTARSAERTGRYLSGQLVADGRVLAGSGAKLVSWSDGWRPSGWVPF